MTTDGVTVYAVDPTWSNETRQEILDFFSIVGISESTATREIIRGDAATLEFYNQSHSFRWYRNDLPARLRSESPVPPDAPSRSTIAEDYLANSGWNHTSWGKSLSATAQPFPNSSVISEATRFTANSESALAQTVAHHVNYSLYSNDIQLGLPSRLRIMVDSDDAVCEVTLISRVPVGNPVQTVAMASVRARLGDLAIQIRSDVSFEGSPRIEDLRWFTLPPLHPQPWLVPVFQVPGVRRPDMIPDVRSYLAFKPTQDVLSWVSSLEGLIIL